MRRVQPGPVWEERNEKGALVVRLLLLALVLLVLVVGLALAARALRQIDTGDESFDQRIDRVEIDVDAGRVIVEGSRRDDVAVRVTRRFVLRRPEVRSRVEGRVLRLEADCPRAIAWITCSVDHRLRVPASVPVRVRIDAGKAEVSGLRADLDVGTQAGNVELDRVGGSVEAHTDAGDVDGTDLEAPRVRASTNAGSVELSFRSPPRQVDASTNAGNVELALPEGAYRVEADTNAGDVDVDDRLRSPGADRQVSAHTNAGNVRVRRR